MESGRPLLPVAGRWSIADLWATTVAVLRVLLFDADLDFDSAISCAIVKMMIRWLFVLAMAFKFFGRIWGKCFRHKRYRKEFEDLPFDVTIQILKYLGAKQSAKMCVINKRFKSIVSDDHLWMYFLQEEDPCGLFAESHLRSLRTLPSAPSLSWMTIYGQRAQVPRAVIIDGGLGYARFGWSKDSAPSRTSEISLALHNSYPVFSGNLSLL
uniref:F-box domain-containing protein n=1 Tax=Solanum lycopersicum TaxID=4081 RepID=A0A3Q7J9T3_SOLLC